MLRAPAPALPFLLALGLIAHAPRPAGATVVRALSLEEKTYAAPVIIHATVERVESAWEIPDSSLHTLVTVRVLESLRGGFAPGDRLTIRQLGGDMGDLHQVVSGQSRYEPAEEVVLFLEPSGPDYVEIGVGIAKYAIDRFPSPEANGERLVRHAPEVAEAHLAAGGAVRMIAPVTPMVPEPLPRFLARLRGLVARQPGRR